MIISDIDQGTPEWHAWRDEGVTASDVAAIFGASEFKTHWQLWAEKSGLRQPDDIDRNPYVRRGKKYEHLLREHLVAERRIGIIPCCVEHQEHRLIRASLDGLDRNRRPWELKIPSEGNFELVRQERMDSAPARKYFMQVQHQLLCTGASEGYLVFGRLNDPLAPNPRIAEKILLTVPADPVIQAEIIRRCAEFHDSIVRGIEPEKDPERDVFSPEEDEEAERWRDHASRVVPLLQRKQQLDAELSEIKEKIEAESGAIKDILGINKAGEFAGLRIIQVRKTGSVDWPEYAKSKGDDPKDEKVVGPFRKAGSKSYQLKLLT